MRLITWELFPGEHLARVLRCLDFRGINFTPMDHSRKKIPKGGHFSFYQIYVNNHRIILILVLVAIIWFYRAEGCFVKRKNSSITIQ